MSALALTFPALLACLLIVEAWARWGPVAGCATVGWVLCVLAAKACISRRGAKR